LERLSGDKQLLILFLLSVSKEKWFYNIDPRFENLTVADPFYALPLLTSTSLYLQFKFAAEGVSMETAGANVIKRFRPTFVNFHNKLEFFPGKLSQPRLLNTPAWYKNS
jgi:hypothetical protein